MRAVVILYDGKKLPESCQSAIGEMIIQNTNGQNATLHTLNNEEVEKCTVMSVIKMAAESKNQEEDEVFKKAIKILGDALKGGSEIEIVAKLLEAKMNPSTSMNKRGAIKNAVTVIGEYSMPSILISNYGMTRHAIKACQTLCKAEIF